MADTRKKPRTASSKTRGRAGEDTDPPGAKEGVYFQYWDPMAGTPAYHDAADGLQRLDFVIHAAGLRGLKLILPLVNNWREFGGMDQYAAWFGLRSHDEFYIDSGARDAGADRQRRPMKFDSLRSGIDRDRRCPVGVACGK